MSGHVFHPGHEELHGVTVVVEGASGRTYVGRYHERVERGIAMRDVATHDPAAAPHDREAWLAAVRGIRPRGVHLYTIDRAPALARLRPVPPFVLQSLADRLRSDGIAADVFV